MKQVPQIALNKVAPPAVGKLQLGNLPPREEEVKNTAKPSGLSLGTDKIAAAQKMQLSMPEPKPSKGPGFSLNLG